MLCLNRVSILTFLCGFVLSNSAVLASENTTVNDSLSRLGGEWNFNIGAGRIEDEASDLNAVQFGIHSKLKYSLHPHLDVEIEPKANFQMGRGQSLYGDYEPTNSIYLTQSMASWRPIHQIKLV